MLKLSNVHAFYGKSHVLHGVNFEVRDGEIVALLGRNGSGRSTTVKTIMGLVEGTGSVRWREREVLGSAAYEIAHAGLGYVPENRDIFPTLTVHQNLMLGEKGGRKKSRWGFDDMYKLFPRLKERQHTEAGVLSGGEQQMLTLCRTLMGDPELIMIDEPTEGLAPKIVELVAEYLRELKRRGIGVLLVEQKLTIALPGDGTRPDRLRGHAGRPARQRLHPQGVAGGVARARAATAPGPALSPQGQRPAFFAT
jgi:branched-chain amino acid transport system ATP-binding protein